MTIDLYRLLVDAGFVVLIWAVQLVIYPSFNYYSPENLLAWHKRYTLRVTFIVLPLMFSQLLLALYQFYLEQSTYTSLSLLIILFLWVVTFVIFVPLHRSIDLNSPAPMVCQKLVRKNWVRTILWSLLFFISLYHVLTC